MFFIHAVRLKYLRIAHGYVIILMPEKFSITFFPSLIRSNQITLKKKKDLCDVCRI